MSALITPSDITPTINQLIIAQNALESTAVPIPLITAPVDPSQIVPTVNNLINQMNAQAASATVPLLALNRVIVALGDSITAGSNGISYFPYGIAYGGGKFYCPPGFNGGVSGNTTTQMLARVATYTAMNPKVAVVLGGINDILMVPVSNTVIEANLTAIYAAFNAVGAHVVALTVLPCTFSGGPVYTTAMEAQRLALNSWIMSQQGPNLTVLNCDAISLNMTTPNGSPDGLHLTQASAQIIAKAFGQVLASLVVPTPITSLGYGQLPTSRGLLQGSTALSGNSSGFIPTGWSCTNNSGATVVGSLGTDANGNNQWICTISGTVTTAGIITFQTTNNFNWVPGDVQDGWIQITATGLSGPVDTFSPPAVADSGLPLTYAGLATGVNSGPFIGRVGQSRNAQGTTGAPGSINTIWGCWVGLGAVNAVVTYQQPYFAIVPGGVYP